MPRSVTARLTLRFVCLLAVAFLLAFLFLTETLDRLLLIRLDEHLLVEAHEFDTVFAVSRPEQLGPLFRKEGEAEGAEKVFLRLLEENGRVVVAQSALDAFPGLPFPRGTFSPKEAKLESLHLAGRSDEIRVVTRRQSDGRIFQMGISRSGDLRFLSELRLLIGGAFALLLSVGAFLGWSTARHAMAGVERVSRIAARVGRGELAHRVPPGQEGREIQVLADCFNGMLGRIQDLVAELEEVTNAIAHDLRSPLTRIRGCAETSLLVGASEGELREMAGTVIDECDRLVEMINTMLAIARTEAAGESLPTEPVDLSEVASEAVELFEPLAEKEGIAIHRGEDASDARIWGDRAKLQRITANLVDNAIKFTPSGGRVDVRVEEADGAYRLVVEDTGPGLEAEQIERIFERFYRADGSRTTPGSGLGLSLAKAYAKAHGGAIAVESRPGEGSRFVVVLPRRDLEKMTDRSSDGQLDVRSAD